MKKRIIGGLLAGCLATYGALLAGPAQGGTILQPVAATANVPDSVSLGVTPIVLVDQSGLSAGYVSGVTDFDAYIASNPTHLNDCFPCTLWASEVGTTAAELTFDLGGTAVVESMALWNRTIGSGQGVRDFRLVASTDALFTSPVLLGAFTAQEDLGVPEATEAEVFSFAATSAAFIRMEVLNVYGACCVSLSEVAFESGTLVLTPEHGTLAILGLGVAGLGLSRRCKTA